MKVLVLYPHPPEPDGVSMQGHYLVKGLRENGVEVMPCDRENNIQKEWCYKSFQPDVVVGVGFWGDTPGLIDDPLLYDLVINTDSISYEEAASIIGHAALLL